MGVVTARPDVSSGGVRGADVLRSMEWVLTALVFAYISRSAWKNFHQNWAIIRQYRPLIFLKSLAVIVVVVGVCVVLNKVPFLAANPFLWVLKMLGLVKNASAGNVMLTGLNHNWYRALFLPILVLAVPTLARDEEELFRKGTLDWREGLLRSLFFGLAHTIMLIPLSAALALTLSGLWFTRQYFLGGIERSTVYHSVYNTMLAGYLFSVLFI